MTSPAAGAMGTGGRWRRELAVAMAVGTAIFAVTLVPYLLAAAWAPAGREFNGFFFIADDAATYVAKMRQGAAGAWGWSDPYISQPSAQPVLLFLFYLLWGKLAALLHVSMFTGYHLARWSGAVALVAGVRALARATLETPRARLVAVVLGLLGSGAGWLLQLLGALSGVHVLLGQHLDALELHLPELSGFYSIMAIPHFAWAAALMAFAVVGILELDATPAGAPVRGRVATLVLVLLVLCLIHPQMLFVLAALTAFHLLTRRAGRRGWLLVSVPFAICVPLLAYFLRILTADPVVLAWSSQWRHQAPEPLGFVFGLGVPLGLAAVALAAGPRRLPPGLRLLAAWVLLVFLLLYLPNPVNIQRRLIDGVYLPVAVLAAAGLEVVIARRGRRARGPFRRPGPLAVLALGVSLVMTVLVWASAMTAAGHEPIIYASRAEIAAIEWLGHAGGDGPTPAVLSHPDTGLFIPERSGYRVYVGHYSETIDYLAKARVAFRAYQGGAATVVALMRSAGTDYVFLGPLESAIPGAPATDDLRAAGLVVVYDRDGVAILRLPG